MIRLEGVSKSYNGKLIVSSFDFCLNDGEKVVLSGESGCGKTTVYRIISGLEKPDSGKVISTGGRYTFVFQENRLLPDVTALSNLTAVGVDKHKAEEYLNKTGLYADINKYPSQMSGGMKRRLSLCRCLCYGGDVYFLDEPLRELDEATAEKMLTLLKTELESKTAFIITHSDREADYLATRRIYAEGKSFTLIKT